LRKVCQPRVRDHAGAVRPAVDQIAEQDDAVVERGRAAISRSMAAIMRLEQI
jgi:hypothetical protein